MRTKKQLFAQQRKFLMSGWRYTTLGGLISLLKDQNPLTAKERTQLEQAFKLVEAFHLSYNTNTKLLEKQL